MDKPQSGYMLPPLRGSPATNPKSVTKSKSWTNRSARHQAIAESHVTSQNVT
jgi:hypothetical protein